MPKIYRSMRKNEEDKPVAEPSALGLGVRVDNSVGNSDVELDDKSNVILNNKGMSVAPRLKDLPYYRISKRLKHKIRKARGPENIYCFTMGDGQFRNAEISDTLGLIVDSKRHGGVAPRSMVSIEEYQSNLAATQQEWSIDEV